MPFSIDEFRTLNRCLDNAIAEAVTEFSFQKDLSMLAKRGAEERERQGFFVHELRNHLNTASLAFSAARSGNLNLSGATGSVLDRSLSSLKFLMEQSLSNFGETEPAAITFKRFSLAEFITELQAAAELNADSKKCSLSVSPVEPELFIEADRELLFAAVGNLLQNAFKFTLPGTVVTLDAYALADRILIDVKDHCGGLPVGAAEEIFKPFVQVGDDRTGLGLGLSIARRSVSMNRGVLSVRDLPGDGCIFTVSLPRFSRPQETS